jgi:hypothetical protein
MTAGQSRSNWTGSLLREYMEFGIVGTATILARYTSGLTQISNLHMNQSNPERTVSSTPNPWISLLLTAGTAFIALLWLVLALRSGGLHSPMAVGVALMIALLLRASGMRAGWKRGVLALLVTAAIAALVNWCIIALQVGLPLGLDGWESLTHLGFHFAQTLFGLAATTNDFIWLALALLMAFMQGK